MILTLVACSDRGESRGRLRQAEGRQVSPHGERVALAASFVGRRSDVLGRLLHDSVIVQPPLPDSARQGTAAIRYVRDLAVNTQVAESRLTPSAITAEGPFVLEQGIWMLRVGDRPLTGHYTLRWRQTPAGWKVVLWRWSTFR